MSTIRVGRNGQNTFVSGETTVSNVPLASEGMSDEQKVRFIESVRQMPKEKWVSALRSAGLNEEADDCERSLAAEHLLELQLTEREKRLKEILAMDEEERLPLLIAEGFEEVAASLSEKLSAGMEEHEDEGNGEENQAQEEEVGVEPSPLSNDASSDKESSVSAGDTSPVIEPEKPKKVARARASRATRSTRSKK